MAAEVEPEAHPNFGPMLIGVLFSAFLFGVLSLQTYLYYSRRSCRVYIHLAVALIWSLNVLHLCLLSHAVYYYLVTNFSNPAVDKVEIWSISLDLAVMSLITFVVQCFFVCQLWSYNIRNRLLIGAILFLMLIRLGVGIGATAIRFEETTFGQSHRSDVWLTICFATMLPTDVWITACMIYTMYTRRKYEFQYFTFWYKIFLYVMTTGFLPVTIIIVAFLFFFLQNTGFVSLAIHFVPSELYTITVFSLLYTCPILSSEGTQTGRVKQTVTEDSIATMKSYGKSMTRKHELETHCSELTISGQHQGPHDTLPSLEYRGKRDVQVFTPVHEIPMTADENDGDIRDSLAHNRCASSGSQRNSGPSHGRSASRHSFQTDSTVRSRTTGPSMAWESVASQSFERVGHDIGNVEWDGNILHWEPTTQ